MTTKQKVSQPVQHQMKDYTGWGSTPLGVMTVESARLIAHDMHSKDKDKSGQPYHLHLDAVQMGVIVLGGSEEEQIAALFHDAVEDHHTTLKHLGALGCTPHTLTMIEAVSKRSNEEQNKYLARIIAAGKGACRVKVADLLHNTRHDRMAAVSEHTRDRLLKKYRPALAALMMELELLTDEEGQKKLATKPLGSAGGYPASGGGYGSSWAAKPFTVTVKSLYPGDWPSTWDAPIARITHLDGKSAFILANGEERIEAWSTAQKNPRKVAVHSEHAWKSGSVKDATPAQIAEFLAVVTSAKSGTKHADSPMF